LFFVIAFKFRPGPHAASGIGVQRSDNLSRFPLGTQRLMGSLTKTEGPKFVVVSVKRHSSISFYPNSSVVRGYVKVRIDLFSVLH
jgi:hypothetical protein